MFEQVDATLRAAIEAGVCPGAAVAIGNRAGTLHTAAAGAAGLDPDAPVRTDTLFRLASLTKAVTSVAAMQLAEQGAIKLDATAADYAPELREIQVLDGFDGGGAPRLRPPARPPTMRELLSHTSGFGYTIWHEGLAQHAAYTGGTLTGDGILASPLAHDPGAVWEYSISTDWLGRIVELVSGRDLNDYVRSHICEPLQMPDTSFLPDAAQRARLATVYQREAAGFGVSPLQDIGDGSFFSGGGGMYSTVGDYLRFQRALLREGELDDARILRPETVRMMGTNQIGELTAGALHSIDPSISADVTFFPETVCRFGLGFLLNEHALHTGRGAGSWSWAGLFNAYYWIDPRQDVAAVIMMQFLPFADPRAMELYAAVESAVYAALEND